MMKQKLRNMYIIEVSLVDKGANGKKFLLIKREDEITELTIKTDATFDGTTLSVNGEEVKDLKSFWFMLWPPDDFDDGMVQGSYTVNETDGAEFDRETTFNLKKGMNTMKLEDVLKKLNVDPASLSAEKTTDLESLLKFIDMMPPEDGASALNIIKASLVKEEAPVAEDAATTEEPAEDRRDPEEVARIKAAISVLNDSLPESERSVLKVEEPDKLDRILAALEKANQPAGSGGEADDAPQTAQEILLALSKRVEKVEKTTGVSEDDEEEGEGIGSDIPLTSEENLAKYGTKYPKAATNFGLGLIQSQ